MEQQGEKALGSDPHGAKRPRSPETFPGLSLDCDEMETIPGRFAEEEDGVDGRTQHRTVTQPTGGFIQCGEINQLTWTWNTSQNGFSLIINVRLNASSVSDRKSSDSVLKYEDVPLASLPQRLLFDSVVQFE